MRILWLSNLAPGPVQEKLTGKKASGLWMDHVLTDLQQEPGISLRILCPAGQKQQGALSPSVSYCTFRRIQPDLISHEQTELFCHQLREFKPDVVHIWGTEFGHTLAMVRACRQENLLDRTVIGIQGLCSYVARHYLEGLPLPVQRRYTLRDLIRQDNLLQQQRKFAHRGAHEREALQQVSHVIGRTHWDRACVRQCSPAAKYHVCNETLRPSFYQGSWRYADCRKHRIFVSSQLYPIKGFHYALEAFSQILGDFPDAVLAVPGKNPCCSGRARLRQDSYARYLAELIRDRGLSQHMEFLGSLSEQEMHRQFLQANVFVMPSAIENSSNSLGEAMLLGVPCAAAMVGGTATMLKPDEGILYQGTAPYMLAEAVRQIFDLGEEAQKMGARAAAHARITHDPERNRKALLEIYEEIAGED